MANHNGIILKHYYYLAPEIYNYMKGLLLNAFYDAIQYNIGWIITYIFIFLMVIELIYVMSKYLHSRPKK